MMCAFHAIFVAASRESAGGIQNPFSRALTSRGYNSKQSADVADERPGIQRDSLRWKARDHSTPAGSLHHHPRQIHESLPGKSQMQDAPPQTRQPPVIPMIVQLQAHFGHAHAAGREGRWEETTPELLLFVSVRRNVEARAHSFAKRFHIQRGPACSPVLENKGATMQFHTQF
jgi:hypothetical protein